MGYRSEVFIGVQKESKDQIRKALEKHDLLDWFKKVERTFTMYDYPDQKDRKEDWVIYHASWIKWGYPYESVKEIEQIVKDLSEEDKAFQVALGEDGAVHSEIGEYWNYIEHRSELVILED